jgi:undecaprenyl diphosphate synthase
MTSEHKHSGRAWWGACLRLLGIRKKNAAEGRQEHATLPRHIAIIMDGNGRWATRQGLPRTAGHKAGVEALREIIRECDHIGIEALSIYAFSTENWKRSAEEVGALMGLLLTYFNSEIDELDEKNVCIRILGDVDGLPEAQRNAVNAAMARTKDNTGLKLNIALNYGGRDELLRAAKTLAARAAAGDIRPEEITRSDLESALYTHDLPDVDLLIRTSGEMRVSNFMLYQIAYAEFVVTDTLWPDFDVRALHEAIAAYQKRDRRFGGVKTGTKGDKKA